MTDGGALDAPPPMGGLGNFKGVMLCNRPSDEPAKVNGGDGAGPFKSMVSSSDREQLGLTPFKHFEPSVKKRGPSAALRRHVRWLKELQDQMKVEQEQVDAEDLAAEAKKERMKAIVAKHREGVREMMNERDQHAEAANSGVTRELPSASAQPHAIPKKADATAKRQKPLWAMTEKEKDTTEDAEADDLINFAEGLDYEKFVGDLEFRQGLEALKDRMGKLKKEQDAFKDALLSEFNSKVDEEESTNAGTPRGSVRLEDGIDGQSLLGDLMSEYSASSAGRSRGAERYNKELDWDSSTACGEERRGIDPELRSVAEMVLESAPHIRAVHSKESVQRIVEKTREKAVEPMGLVQCMAQESAVLAPVITASADTQTRLHKPVDPSTLPYLYRSPAV